MGTAAADMGSRCRSAGTASNRRLDPSHRTTPTEETPMSARPLDPHEATPRQRREQLPDETARHRPAAAATAGRRRRQLRLRRVWTATAARPGHGGAA